MLKIDAKALPERDQDAGIIQVSETIIVISISHNKKRSRAILERFVIL